MLTATAPRFRVPHRVHALVVGGFLAFACASESGEAVSVNTDSQAGGTTNSSGAGGSLAGGQGGASPRNNDGGATTSNGGSTPRGGAAAASGGTASGGMRASGGMAASGGSGAATETGGDSASGGMASTRPGLPHGPQDLIGWAAMPGMGLDTTTGGGDSPPQTATSMDELSQLVSGDSPAVIMVSGSLKGSVKIGSNKTIIGMSDARIDGSIAMFDVQNVIVKNLTIQGGSDTINISTNAHHIWLDHLDISDGSDGILDIIRGSDHITMSWSKIHYTRTGGHRFASLIGNSNGLGDLDRGHLKVTYHHNWWADGVQQRQPRVRFGQVHVFNSLFTSQDTDYAIRAGVDAQILTENNVFKGMKVFDYGSSNASAALKTVEDVFVDCSSTEGKPGTVFTPPYPYQLDPTDALEAAVMAGAGPQ